MLWFLLGVLVGWFMRGGREEELQSDGRVYCNYEFEDPVDGTEADCRHLDSGCDKEHRS